MLLEDKNIITGTFVSITSGRFPSCMTPVSITTQRQGKAA